MSLQHSFTGLNGRPGISTVAQTFENEFLWGNWYIQQHTGLLIDSSARDVGNTGNPEILRQGILLGKVESTQTLTVWNPNATDGSEYIFGVLNQTVSMRSLSGTQDRLNGFIVMSGGLQVDRIIIPGSVNVGIVGNPLEYQVRALLRPNFLLNDSYQYARPDDFITTIPSSASPMALTHLQSHKRFHSNANVTMTLPTPIRGVKFTFYNDGATTTVGSNSANIKVPGAAPATSLTVSDEVITLIGTGTQWLQV